jgi:GxxExxY protein
MTPIQTNLDGSAERDPQTYAIIGAAMEVHRELGRGFLEAVYDEALAVEFRTRSIAHQRQPDLVVNYKGQPLSVSYCPDFFALTRSLLRLRPSRN